MPFILVQPDYLFSEVEIFSCCPIPIIECILKSTQLEFHSGALPCHVEQYMLPRDGRTEPESERQHDERKSMPEWKLSFVILPMGLRMFPYN